MFNGEHLVFDARSADQRAVTVEVRDYDTLRITRGTATADATTIFVRAHNRWGQETTSFVVSKDATALAAGLTLRAVPGFRLKGAATAQAITVQWNAPLAVGGPAGTVGSVVVEFKRDDASTWRVAVAEGDFAAGETTISNLEPGTAYDVRIRVAAKNASGVLIGHGPATALDIRTLTVVNLPGVLRALPSLSVEDSAGAAREADAPARFLLLACDHLQRAAHGGGLAGGSQYLRRADSVQVSFTGATVDYSATISVTATNSAGSVTRTLTASYDYRAVAAVAASGSISGAVGAGRVRQRPVRFGLLRQRLGCHLLGGGGEPGGRGFERPGH